MVDLHVAVDQGSPVPLHHQVSSQLAAAIAAGRLPKGSYPSSELELAARWGISRPTARRAIQELVDQGLPVRRRGVGTQVVSAPPGSGHIGCGNVHPRSTIGFWGWLDGG